DIDPMDDLVFDEAGLSKGIGFYVYSPPDDHEATSLWIESRCVALSIAPDMSKADWSEILAFSFPEHVIQEMSRTKAGQLLVLLSRISHYSRIGICFLDGGVEEIWEKSFNDCLRNILPMFLLPWDVSPNILFI